MAFAKEFEYRKEVLASGIVQVRRAEIVLEDGAEIARSYRRWSLTPGQDVSREEASVQAICNAAWTAEVVAAYEASLPVEEPEVEEPEVEEPAE